MSPYNLQTSVLALVVALTATACGSGESMYDDARDESFLALMGSGDGKADSLVVTDGSPEALAVLEVVNTLGFDALEREAGLQRRLIANLIAHRDGNGSDPGDDNPYDSLAELDATPWTTMAAFRKMYRHAHDAGFVDAMQRPRACDVDTDCGTTGFCHTDRCYDTETVQLDIDGASSFDVGPDGEWWLRAHAGGTTVREARGTDTLTTVDTSTFDDSDLDPWVVRLQDGTLTSVTRSGDTVIPEFGTAVVLGSLTRAVDAAYDTDGTLYLAAAALDTHGAIEGVVVLRRGEDGWVEELKEPFVGTSIDVLNAVFVRNADGHPQLWVDVDDAARRFSRDDDGRWRESMVLDMANAGFGEHPGDRTVHFSSASDGTVFIHRSTWAFARRHELVRIDGNMVTAVMDLPTAARAVVAHPGGNASIVYADGSLGHIANHMPHRGEATPLDHVQPGDIVRTSGDSIYVLQSGTVKILRPRDEP